MNDTVKAVLGMHDNGYITEHQALEVLRHEAGLTARTPQSEALGRVIDAVSAGTLPPEALKAALTDSKYVIRHTVPVFVYVENGKVARVVGDDERLSEPLKIVPGQTLEGGWMDEDERPLTEEERLKYAADMESSEAWPAWEWGF